MEIPVVLPAPGIPGTPSGSPNPNTGTYTVSFSAASGSVGLYRVYESTSATGSYTQIATPAGTSHAISNKSPGTYYYKVAACNGAGNTTCSAQSAASSGVIVNGPAPGIPGTPSGSPNPNTGSYTVSFSAASGSVGLYRVYESTSATGSYTQIATPTGTSHAISNKSPGTYYYKVAACNGAGNTTCSAQSAASSGVMVNAAASETVTYLHSDTLGNVIGESKADGTFTRYHYKPYGERVESQPERLGFTGHLHQKELGLTYMQARHFDPLMGRFYGNDPIGFTGDPMTFNRYAYVNNNPYKYTDPTGRWATWIHRRITYNAAIRAGLSDAKAREWASAVVKVDEGTQSGNAFDTNVHGMAGRKSDGDMQTRGEAIAASTALVRNKDANKHQRAHAAQDMTAPHHLGEVWNDPFEITRGTDLVTIVGNALSALAHVIQDVFISDEQEEQATEETAEIIKEAEKPKEDAQ